MEKIISYQSLFPSIVGITSFKGYNDIKQDLIEHCFKIKENFPSGGKNWLSKSTYNTLLSYDILKDDKFKKINEWVLEQVNQYAKDVQSRNTLYIECAWFNIYNKHDYQEYHDHFKNTLSAIFYVQNEKGHPKTVFQSNEKSSVTDLEFDNNILHGSKRVYYAPPSGSLLIFPSHLTHCVEKQDINIPRITIAYNCNKK